MIKILISYTLLLVFAESAVGNKSEILNMSDASTESKLEPVVATPTTNKIYTSKTLLESHISEVIIESPKQSQSVATIDSLGRLTIECEVREKQPAINAEQEQ
jgi:hypothetical protein